MKIIIDTDPAMGYIFRDVDDGLAILFLLNCDEVEVIGITTCYGNATGKSTHTKALEILDKAGEKDIPIVAGANMPGRHNRPNDAARFILDMVRKYSGEVTILTLAPLSNIASAIRVDPEFLLFVKAVVSLGGSIFSKGFLPPFWPMELNFWFDVKATDMVLSSQVSKTIIPVDVCRKVLFTQKEAGRLKILGGDINRYILDNISHWLRVSPLIYRKRGFYPWDLIAASYLVRPDLFTIEKMCLSIRTKGIGRGKVEVRHAEVPTTTVVVDLNVERFWSLYFEKMGINR